MAPGPPGPKGERGAVGRTGAQGAKGEKGQDGKSGVKYVHWGRTTCPSGAQLVYKGRNWLTLNMSLCGFICRQILIFYSSDA